MSVNQPTLFGTYEWGQTTGAAPTLFANGFVPQTYSLSLSESITDTDADIFSAVKALSDSATLTDAQVKTLSHAFADSVTPSVAIAKTLAKVFADSASVSDGSVVFTVKSLTDFLVLKEWIAIRLTKSINWVNPVSNENTVDTLWARSNDGPVLWAGKNVLFGGVKPSSSWTAGPRKSPSVWTNSDGAKYNY